MSPLTHVGAETLLERYQELIKRAAELLRRAEFMTEDGDQDQGREADRDQWLRDAGIEK
jgi:hypothetical protein